MDLGREEDPETFVPAAGKCLVREVFACQQANVDGLFRLGTRVGHEVVPVGAGSAAPLVIIDRQQLSRTPSTRLLSP